VDKQAIADSTIIAFEKSLLKNQIDSVFKKYQFNGSVAVFKDSVELYRKNQGFADFKDQLKMNDSTVFAIGSVSKQFTAALILLQMEQGKLNVDDKVSTYLKEFQNKNYENITIHQLLNHTSGLNTLGGKLQFKSEQISFIPTTVLIHWEKLWFRVNRMTKMFWIYLKQPE
jgi:CubicO group peptidase (beta-lactamase class C family)